MISPKPYIERIVGDERVRSNMTDDQFRPLVNASCDFLIALARVATNEMQLQSACDELFEMIRGANNSLAEAK